ncbi:DUF2970 domain-containing protein [Parahaliea sp. F7430]|uniref:DUF2970 domain-containing protein n=1 Tax=Sediminihaliea albiluteola TaxID=2758564 RepID=A0A7W2YJE1_9GAMM|nr:DUF2970 domain-containing protein [Sediminihaliea albiluteola]
MQQPTEDKVSTTEVVGSILAAGFGVQSSRNRERDFKRGKFGAFLLAGVILTTVFVATLFTIVKLVVSTAGS